MAEIENLKIGNGGTLHIVGNEDIVANAWQAGKTYVKNKSYVIREHRLYVCNVTHTSVEPFDATKWTEITIGDAIGNNIGDLSTLTTTDKSSVVGAVNEVNAGLANKSNPLMVSTTALSINYGGARYKSQNVDVARTGYTVLGVVGYSLSSIDNIVFSIRMSSTPNTLVVGIQTRDGSNSNATITGYVDVLYVKKD